MKRFIVCNYEHPGSWAFTDSSDEARALSTQNVAAVYVRIELHAIRSLQRLLELHQDEFAEGVRRRAWKEERILTAPFCDLCGVPLKMADATLDHVVPLVEGGADEPDNWILSCAPCNKKKGRMSLQDFVQRTLDAPAFRRVVARELVQV